MVRKLLPLTVVLAAAALPGAAHAAVVSDVSAGRTTSASTSPRLPAVEPPPRLEAVDAAEAVSQMLTARLANVA